MKKGNYHESVMVEEVVGALHIEKKGKYIDATAGNGGHMLAILEKGGEVLGIDMDPEMVEIADKRLQGKAKVVQGNFVDIDKIAKDNGFEHPQGILFDLGVSNIHLKDLERGFSFENSKAILDMRLNPQAQGVKASDLLNVLREDQLRELFEITLEPGAAKWISGRVIHSRDQKPITTVGDMLEICEGIKTGKTSLNEATLPFLALRIAVNSELDNLKSVLPKAFGILAPGGILAVISFHSKEDEITKDFMKETIAQGSGKAITFKPLLAGQEEIEINRRARSAKMRILEKV